MFNFIQRIIPGRSYWHTAPFTELAELYAARFLRSIAQNMVGVFVAVYLYQNGYALAHIMFFVSGYYLLRAIASFGFAYYVAWVGPKRSMLVSNILLIPALVSLTLIDRYILGGVLAYFIFQALSLSLFVIASDMHFSMIKHDQRVGKEIGFLHIAEKLAAGVAPMVGGFVAFIFGPESTIWIAALLSVFSAVPLFMTPERVRRKQKIIFHGLPWRVIGDQLISHTAAGADQVVSGVTWSIFVAIVVFGTEGNSIYAKLGVMFSVALIASVITSHLFGVLIDRRRGHELFVTGVILNSIFHAIRPFVVTSTGVLTMNAANEIGTSAYQMPYVRSQYDTADNLPGYRVAYTSMMMVTFCLGAAVFSLMTAVAMYYIGDVNGLKLSFIAMAGASYLMLVQNFRSLRVRRRP